MLEQARKDKSFLDRINYPRGHPAEKRQTFLKQGGRALDRLRELLDGLSGVIVPAAIAEEEEGSNPVSI
jgi:hypothetical protein